MKKLTISKRIIFTLFAVLVSVNLWGQTLSPLSSEPGAAEPGTEENPYVIATNSDWNTFATTSLYWGEGVYVQLGDNWNNSENPVTTMVGYETDDTPFSGTFDGNNKILNVSYSEIYYNAPFYYTDGATIKNLTVTGNVVASGGYSAGIVYSTSTDVGRTIVNDVTVSVNISASGQKYCAGFAVYSLGLDFSNCVYNGQIIAGDNSGGFSASYYESGKATFENCIFNPASGSSITGGENFGNGIIIENCYYTMQVGSSEQGTRLYKNHSDAPGDIIVKPWVILGENVYGPVTVTTTAEETYLYDAGTNYYSTVTGCAVTFDGNTVVKDKDYTVSVKKNSAVVTEVTTAGEYQLIIEGSGDYHGSYSQTFYVVDDLTGGGTAENPYIISSTVDWLVFANKVNTGASGYATAYYKLTEDIAVSTMVGTAGHPFKGHFSGRDGETNNTKTLTFNYGTSETPTEEEIVAPFRYTYGATIEFLQVSGAIYTNVGKQAGLIGVNTRTSTNTSVTKVIISVNFYCNEALWDAEGGGAAYDGSGVTFNSCAYRGFISTNNYHGGICGKANGNTTLTNCLFNPLEGGVYWAENFVYDAQGASIDYSSCYYSEGNNQDESTQGTLVYVETVPVEKVGRQITELYGVGIYLPVTVVIGNVASTYIHTGSVITVNPSVTFNGTDAIANNYCTTEIYPTTVQDVGNYTLTITAKDAGEGHNYSGCVTKEFRVVEGTSTDWAELQAALSGSNPTITLNKDYTAGASDMALTIDRDVTIYLNGHTINRALTDETFTPGGQVLRIGHGANVTIVGRGTITGGRNQGSSTIEHGTNNDGGAIYNMGNLTLIGYKDAENGYDTIFIVNNRCVKYNPENPGTSRTARGGAIYSGNGSSLTVHGCVIRENSAQGGGGGIFVDRAVFTMDHNTLIRSNNSLDKGGGLRVDANGVATAHINDCEISSNTVQYHSDQSASNGGGIHLDGGNLDMINCIIDNNNSSKYGGGIYIMGGTLYAKDCTISYNQSYDKANKFEGYGGGVCVLNGTFKMNGGTIMGNSSYKEDGGGVFVAAGKTFKIEGAVNISENWTYQDASLTTQHTTNVYLKGANDKIIINSSITGAYVGVSKKGGSGRFTSGLSGKGTIENFSSDNADYHVLPDSGEAKLDVPEPWVDPTLDPETHTITIDEPTTISTVVTVDSDYTIVFTGDGCLIITKDGILTAKIENDNPLQLIIEDGGQVITTSAGVKAKVEKEIEKFSNIAPIDNWYLISSPINSPAITSATNLITVNPDMVVTTPGYDLYRFNEGTTATDANGLLLQWENYRAGHADFTTLENGRGYLYRNSHDYTISMEGTLNVAGVNYTLSNSATNVLRGFNIVGNPYSHNVVKGTAGTGVAIPNTRLENNYYVLNPDGCTWDLTSDGTVIPPLAGILVQATTAGTLAISNEVPSASKRAVEENNSIWFTVANNKYEDKACVEFRNGRGLNKMTHPNEEAPMLYIRHNDEDFASVDMNPEAKMFNLNFEAKTMGYYTLSVEPQGEYSYLHLIDKVTEKEIDLLEEQEYTFIGSTSDAANRFIVRMSLAEDPEESDNEVFAYQSGDEIVVTGEGELHVFDVMGRFVATYNVSGVQTVTKPITAGVYIVKLNEKTQKIIIK